MEDRELIIRFIKEQNDAYFEQLYDRYASVVYGRITGYLGDVAASKDVAQEVWVKIYFNLKSFEFRSAFSTWLYRIVTNECINWIRGKKTAIPLEDVENKIEDNSLEKETDLNIDVTNLLDKVSKEERVLLMLKYVEGYSYKEISKRLDLKESAVKMRVLRAKSKIVESESYE